jgi:hypothetical protein
MAKGVWLKARGQGAQLRGCCWGTQLRAHAQRGRCEAKVSVNKGGGRCHICVAVSQNIPEIQGDIALPKGNARHKGEEGERGGLSHGMCVSERRVRAVGSG